MRTSRATRGRVRVKSGSESLEMGLLRNWTWCLKPLTLLWTAAFSVLNQSYTLLPYLVCTEKMCLSKKAQGPSSILCPHQPASLWVSCLPPILPRKQSLPILPLTSHQLWVPGLRFAMEESDEKPESWFLFSWGGMEVLKGTCTVSTAVLARALILPRMLFLLL